MVTRDFAREHLGLLLMHQLYVVSIFRAFENITREFSICKTRYVSTYKQSFIPLTHPWWVDTSLTIIFQYIRDTHPSRWCIFGIVLAVYARMYYMNTTQKAKKMICSTFEPTSNQSAHFKTMKNVSIQFQSTARVLNSCMQKKMRRGWWVGGS